MRTLDAGTTALAPGTSIHRHPAENGNSAGEGPVFAAPLACGARHRLVVPQGCWPGVRAELVRLGRQRLAFGAPVPLTGGDLAAMGRPALDPRAGAAPVEIGRTVRRVNGGRAA